MDDNNDLISSTIAYGSLNETNDSIFYSNNDKFENVPLLTSWILISYAMFVLVFGISGNLLMIYTILSQKITGTHALFLQLSIVDIFTLTLVALPEIWSLNSGGWVFEPDLCPVFLGTEILTGTITIYLIASFNLHALTTWNLSMKNVKQFLKDNNNPLTKESEYSERESLSYRETLPTRKINIDYRRKRLTLSVVIPSFLIWILSCSLSIPEFGLSTTIKTRDNHVLCSIIDIQQFILLQFLLCLIRIAIPLTLLTFTAINLFVKYFNTKKNNLIDSQSKTNSRVIKIKDLLFVAILLTMSYAIFSVHRAVYAILHVCSAKFVTIIIDKFRMPPLENLVSSRSQSIVFSMLHYFLSAIRFMIFLYIPQIRQRVLDLFRIKCTRNFSAED